eukprot:1284340-Rhodomonas_salina.2
MPIYPWNALQRCHAAAWLFFCSLSEIQHRARSLASPSFCAPTVFLHFVCKTGGTGGGNWRDEGSLRKSNQLSQLCRKAFLCTDRYTGSVL